MQREAGSTVDRPVFLVADAEALNAGANNYWLVECHAFDYAYIEIDCDQQYSAYVIGNTGMGTNDPYHITNDAGSVNNKATITGGSGYGMMCYCGAMGQVGVQVYNTGGSAASVTVRIALASL